MIITTIGLGRSKNIPPPESVEGGFVTPPDEPKEDSGEQHEMADETSDGGFVTKKSSNE